MWGLKQQIQPSTDVLICNIWKWDVTVSQKDEFAVEQAQSKPTGMERRRGSLSEPDLFGFPKWKLQTVTTAIHKYAQTTHIQTEK